MATTVITGSGTIVSSNAAGTTLSAASAPVTNTYTAGQVITFSNAGAVIDTSTGAGSAGILLTIGSVAGATDIIRNSGSVQAYSYGIETTPHGTTTNAVSVTNSGIINVVGGVSTAHNASGIYANGGVQETVDNTGTIIAPTGVFLLPNGASGTFAVSNEGVITATQQFTGGSYKYGIRIQGNPSGALAGTAIITNTGTINGFVDAAVLNATITNKGTITAGVFALGTGTFIDAAGAVNGAKVQFINQNSLQGASGLLSTLDLVAGTVAIGTLSNPSVYTGFGYVTVATGADFQIGNAASAVSIPNVTSIADFGTLNIAGSITGTSINMEGTVTGVNSVVDFTGTNTATPIYNYANNDQVVFGTLALPAPAAGSSFQDSYNSATGVLTTTEINAAGASIASTMVTLTGAPGVSFNSGSFDVLSGPGGETIVLATSQIANGGSIYLDYGEHATLSNVALDSVPVTFGSNGTSLSPNVLQLNDLNQNINNAGATYTGNLAPISGFGSNDIITLGSVNIGAVSTDVITQTYDPTTGRYQIFDDSEYARTGNVNLSTDVLYFTPGSSYSSASFVDTFGTNGINIETPTTAAEQGYTFNASGTADINTLNDYSGMVAPGDSIVSGEVVTIASGTATFASTSASGVSSFFQNSGTILVTGKTSAFTDYATLTGGGTIVAANGGTINVFSATGSDAAQTLQFGTGGTSNAPNTIDLNPTSGTFAGTIAGFGPNDALVLGPNVLPTVSGGTATTSFNASTGVLTVKELNASGTVIGTATETLTGDGNLTSQEFRATQGPNGVTITDSIFIDNGNRVTLTNSSIINTPVTFGTNGTALAPNVLDLNGTSQAVPGTGYYGSETGPITGFGTNDIITEGPNAIAALPTDVLTTSYDTTTGAYQIFDQTAYQRSPNFATSTDVVYFSPAGSYSASSFVETYGTNGINIETAATDAGQGYTFNASGTADINTIQDYSGKVAPGSSIVTGEVVTIASGTATFASANTVPIAGGAAGTYASTFQNSGTILVSGTSSAFTDYATLTGGGTIVAANGGHVNVLDTSGGTDAAQTLLFGTGGTSLAVNTIDLNGTSGTFAGTIAGFGTNDDIVIGPSLIPNDNSFGSSINNYVTLAYAGSLLTVGEVEYQPGGGGTPTTLYTTLNVGTGYSVGSFVALFGTNGINIETPATVLEAPLTLSPTAGATTVSFADPTQYTGGLAPGGSIIAGESIIINAGTALVQIQQPESNSGNILINSGTLQNNANPAGLSDLTGTGTITIQNGGKFSQSVSGGTNTIAFGGDTTSNYNVLAIGNSASSFTSPITGFGSNDEILLAAPMLPSPGTASSYTDTYNTATGALVINEFNGSGSLVGTTTLTVANTGSLNSSSFIEVSGYSPVLNMPVVDVLLGSSTLLSTTGSIYIDNGHSVTLSNTAGVDTIPVTFGTHGSVGAFNTLDINGTVAGTNSPYQGTISGFGLNDDIIIGPSTLPSLAAGSSVTLSYAGSLLTVGEVNSAGSVTATTTLDVGTGYSAGSFVALIGTNGINIETPATVDEQSFTFQSAYNTTGNLGQIAGNFEDPTLYKGGLAPGSSIVAGETVTVLPISLAQLTTPLNNSGVIVLSGSSANLNDAAPLTGNGTILVTGGADFVDTSPTGSTTNTIAFGNSVSGVTNIAYLNTPGTAEFAGVIANFGPGDNIDLGSSFLPTPTSASAISLSFTGGILSIFDTVGGTVYTDMLTISGTVPGTFSASLGTMPDGSTGIVLADVPCFAAGTRILTGGGQVAVESIKVGDKVLTVRDGAEAEVVWVGSRTIDLARHAMPEKVRPIRILAGAFGEGLPERDLRLSPDHALYIDGHLIEAKTLVNGVTVIEEMATRFVTYHHVELANHDIMLAEGLAAESYLDSGNRVMFESDAAPMMLHPDFAAASRAKACAPLATDGDVVVAARARLLERAVTLGFVATGALDLTAHVAGSVVMPEMVGEELLFVLPSGAGSVELVSSVGVPAETSALPGDRRVLGVAVTGLALVAGGKRMVISLKDPAHNGFYEMEDGHRWTNGAARVALPAYTGRAVLEVMINGQAARWVSAA